MQQYPEFEIQEIRSYEGFAEGMPEVTESKSEEFSKTVRIFPHKMHGEGHYLALLKKGEGTKEEPKPSKSKRIKKVPEELAEFLQDIAWEMDFSRLEILTERVYYMPADIPDVKGIRFLRTRFIFGRCEKESI